MFLCKESFPLFVNSNKNALFFLSSNLKLLKHGKWLESNK